MGESVVDGYGCFYRFWAAYATDSYSQRLSIASSERSLAFSNDEFLHCLATDCGPFGHRHSLRHPLDVVELLVYTAGKVRWNRWFQSDYLMISWPKESVCNLRINFEQNGDVILNFCPKCAQITSWSDSEIGLAWDRAEIGEKDYKAHNMCSWTT